MAGFWLVIRVLVTLSPYLNIDSYWVNAVLYTSILLFPFFLFHQYVIYYDPKSNFKGLSRLYELSENFELRTWPKYLIALIFSGLSYWYASGNRINLESTNPIVSGEKMAVLHFQNQTGQPDLDMIGPMVTHWLTEGFIQNGDTKVVSASAVQRAYAAQNIAPGSKMLDLNLSKVLGTQYSIDGVYFIQQDSIILTSSLYDSSTGEVVYSFGSFKGPRDQPLEIIENLRETVLGYWFNRDNIERFPPPRYDAYKKYIEAQTLWGEEDSVVEKLLVESLELDPNFFEPKFLLIALKRNNRNWSLCDSLVSDLYGKQVHLTKSQSTKLNFFRNELAGDFKTAYQYFDVEYGRDKNDLFMNTSMMHFANYRLNDPNLCLLTAEEIKLEEVDFSNCQYCKNRLYNLARAYYQLGNSNKIKTLYQYNKKLDSDQRLEEVFLLDAANSGDHMLIDSIMTTLWNENNDIRYAEHAILLATKYIHLGKSDLAQRWLEAIEIVDDRIAVKDDYYLELKAKQLEMLGKWGKAKEIYQSLKAQFPNVSFYDWRLMGVEAALGNQDEVLEFISMQVSEKKSYDFGYTHYEAARLQALMSNTDLALSHLSNSISQGRQFHITFFEQDWYLASIWNTSKFKDLLRSRRVVEEN